MTVRIKLLASLRKYLPKGHSGDTLTVELADGAAVCGAIAALGIRAEPARMVVSQNEQLAVSAPLRDGQEINLFPPLAGGSC